MKIVYMCQDTVTGMYSALYDAWVESRDQEVGIEFRGQIEHQLFCEYREVTESERKAIAIERLIQKHLGYHTYWDIYHTLLAKDSDKVEAVFKVMQEARELSNSQKIMEHLSSPNVTRVFECSRKVANEAHLFTGFVRFKQLKNGVLFSEIKPKNQVLTCIADYFTDRFPLENWMIYDKTHQTFLVHHKKQHWFLLTGHDVDSEAIQALVEAEDDWERLWQGFCTSISIKERENRSLQRGNLPLRFRENMVEFS